MSSYTLLPEPTLDKDPAAILDYSWDWSAWLAGDTISTFTITPESPLALDSSARVGNVVVGWISGGVAGTKKKLTCRITTAGGRTDERTLNLNIVDR